MFKTISLFLQTVLSMGEEENMHQYPDEEERSDPLRVDKEMLHPDSPLTGRLLALVQVFSVRDFTRVLFSWRFTASIH